MLSLLLIGSSARAAVNGDVIQVGFPSVGGTGEGRDVVRPWAWAPVIVDLTLEGQAGFDGWIRVAQPDRDGDLCFDMQPVQLRPESGLRRYWLYTLINPQSRGANAVTVEVFSRDNEPVELRSGGRPVRVLTPSAPPEVIASQEYLILSVSSRTAGPVARLASMDNAGRLSIPVRIAHIDPGKLPSRWHGLEAVDAVVWDEADATEVTARQLEALAEWVRFGGTLVLAAGKTADTVANSKFLSPLLPVNIGEITSLPALPRVCADLLGWEKEADYRIPVTVAVCTLRDGARNIVRERLADSQTTLIATRRTERGRVVFVAASLRDIFSDRGDPVRFFKKILGLRGNRQTFSLSPVRLFDELEGWIGFRQVGATYVAVALLFALAYVTVATFGSWGFLRRRGWLRYSWTVFGLVALGASVVSVAGVQSVRGVGKKLVQLSIVDADADSSIARAATYFGLKTSLHGLVDAWLPQSFPQFTEPDVTHCVLKPLPTANPTPRTFADPGRYRLFPTRAELRDVPIRGTLKQFEGRWTGTMPGRLRATINLVRGPEVGEMRVGGASSIINELGVDLYRCYLIYTGTDAFSATSAGRADKVFVLRLTDLPKGAAFDDFSRFYINAVGDLREFDDWSKHRTLEWYQAEWKRPFRTFRLGGSQEQAGLDKHLASLLLLSTYGDHTPELDRFGNPKDSEIRADQSRYLNISDLLDHKTALFVGFADVPGPVTLCTRSGGDDYKRVQANKALTMYRIFIPIG
ncbi:MAG: hypothetical protein IID05_02045 [Gemmatimonadetes bacterium]|nr:hypothetical protein [Gemmatimonadota bacterium]